MPPSFAKFVKDLLYGVKPDSFPVLLRNRLLHGSRSSPIQKLPLDVFVDHIFRYLYVDDILNFRQTNKWFFLLTHEPIIWKRFLLRMNIPVPPLRPTFRYSFDRTDFEIEQLVTQAITADDNWRRPNPSIFARRKFASHYTTTSIFMLPGGKYLLASAQSRDRTRFWIIVYMLDHPDGPRALARIPTYSEAYNIEAKFMKLFDEEEGIIISYTRRLFATPQPRHMNSADFSHKHPIDVPGGFTYEVPILYCSMSAMETLAAPELHQGTMEYDSYLGKLPKPFKELSIVSSVDEIEQLSLFEVENNRMLAMIIHPNKLHFLNLQNPNEKSTMIFQDHYAFVGKPHRLRAFRVYPGQRDMVVIRSVSPFPGTESQLVEWHDLPFFMGTVRSTAKSRYTLHEKNVGKFHISDYGHPGRVKLNPDHPTLRHSLGPPPPLSIYLELRDPDGIEHHAIYPRQYVQTPETEASPAQYMYRYDHDTYQMSTHLCSNNTRAHVLPGAYRALLWMVDPEDITDSPRITNLRRYIHPRNSGVHYQPDPPDLNDVEPVLRRDRLPMPRTGVYTTIRTNNYLNEINALGGAQDICWDESTARICVAPRNGDYIFILEGSHIVSPDNRLKQWKQARGHPLDVEMMDTN